MMNPTDAHMQAVAEELDRLRREVQREPAHWAFSRIAELEGVLAAYREDRAWAETRRICARLFANA